MTIMLTQGSSWHCLEHQHIVENGRDVTKFLLLQTQAVLFCNMDTFTCSALQFPHCALAQLIHAGFGSRHDIFWTWFRWLIGFQKPA